LHLLHPNPVAMMFFFRTIIFVLLLTIVCNASAQSPLKPRDTTVKGPQTFAIIMGISRYKYVKPLTYADKDAGLFRDYLKSPAGGRLKEDNIFCLLNEQALNSTFWGKGFQWLRAKQLQRGDRLFIYLAGHGDAIDEDQFFFLGYDCNPGGDKNNYLVSGTIQLYNLKKKIANETSRGVEVFFIMDACRSNELPGGLAGQNFLNNAISEKKVGEIIMLATGAGQESLEDASIGTGHGLFTYYLVDGLTGSADSAGTPDNKITFHEIKSYVDKNVPPLALQRFKRKQDPFFCCNENSEQIIGTVDTAYLRQWLKIKRLETKGPGNSVQLDERSGVINRSYKFITADTVLIETYNLFYKAVKDNNLTGKSSAEEYYLQLNKKYPGNPYTLDAKSTLAVEYINAAQVKVNRYLGCSDDLSAKEKQDNYDAGVNLEKAIMILGEDDPDFANSLLGRMYFLKASGDFGKNGKNGELSISFSNAYGALAIDPNGAYIQNKLALLHLENNKPDSALYYANKATKTAPGWVCAFTTLALVKKAAEQTNPDRNNNNSGKKPIKKNSFGVVAGSGVSQLRPTFTDAINNNVVGINPKNIVRLDVGFIYQAGIGKNISIRPSAIIAMEGGELVYQRQIATGGPITPDPVKLKNTTISVALPLVIRLSDKNIAPFISMGPSFSYVVSQNAAASAKVPVKKSILSGDAGIGLDIGLAKSRLILSPELKFTQGLNNLKEDARTEYTNTLSSLKKQGITFSIYLRGR
jgi:hypothetical protein